MQITYNQMSDKMATDNGNDVLVKNKINLAYIECYGNRKKYKIPTCFTKYHLKQGDIFEARISNIYDLSKFWIVPRFKELEAFQIYLHRFYETNKDLYKIPYDRIEKDLYCIAYTCSNYYRGVLIDFPVTVDTIDKVKIFFYDYGMIELINIDDLYYMESKCFSVPQFAIRASLTGICPKNSYTWTSEHVHKFLEIVKNKILIAQISNIDMKYQIVDLFMKLQYNDDCTIQDQLINEKCAQYFNIDIKIDGKSSKDDIAVEFLYLYPSHEVLESGIVPFDVRHMEFIKELMPIIGPLKQYYKDAATDSYEQTKH